MEPRQIIPAAIAISIVGHLLLTAGVILADARPFESIASQAITVDIVAPEDVPSPAKETPAAAAKPPKPPDPFQLPKFADVNQTPQQDNQQQVSSQSSPQRSAAQPPAAAAPAPAASAQQMPSPPARQQPSQQAALQPSTTSSQPPPPERSHLTPPQAPQQQSPGSPGTPEPDITVKYGVLLGLPSGDGGASAFTTADIAPVDTAAFRQHLKTCSELPASVAPADKVRIVLRAFLEPNGRLVGAPTLIEASASAKGPALMQAAIKALQACQPYGMLPADKYDEWKVLDLSFTPHDFAGG